MGATMGNLLGLCGMSLPIGTGRAGMPLGAVLQCAGGTHESLFAAALAVEPHWRFTGSSTTT